MVKISIIIPVYNTEKYLERCLESILNQEIKEIEVIIVNDGSPDNSYLIIERYRKKDKRIKVISKINGGLSSARNAGIKIAKGEYILHIDSDDWIEDGYFKETYEKAKRNNLDILVSDFMTVFENNKKKYIKDLKISSSEVISGKEYIKLFFDNKIYPAVWNKLIKRELYIKNNILHPENISLGEDLAVTPRLAFYADRIGKINKAYLNYLKNENSITNFNPTKKIYELIQVFTLLENFFEDKKLVNKKKVNDMTKLILNSNYRMDDLFYAKAVEEYLGAIKTVKLSRLNLKLKLIVIILKIYPKIGSLKFLSKIVFLFKKRGVK